MKNNLRQMIKKCGGKITVSYLTKLALLTALSYVLYGFCKFPLPFLFPGFLEMQFSELPAILAGFSMGPFAGSLVIILKCLLKMPLSTTSLVGECIDIILGLAYVLPASILYLFRKTKKGAVASLLVGTICSTAVAMLCNRFIAVPFYVQAFFGGNFDAIVGMCSALYSGINKDNFYMIYLFAAVLPFNLLRLSLVGLVTFFTYKKLSKLLHWEKKNIRKNADGAYLSTCEKDTLAIADEFSKKLTGGEIILLSGELGAGKTTFTKGLCASLGIADTVTSPTFTIMKTYHGKYTVHHMDMYRIESEEDVEELGLWEEIDEKDITIIEWNKFTDLKGKIFDIRIDYVGNERTIKIEERK